MHLSTTDHVGAPSNAYANTQLGSLICECDIARTRILRIVLAIRGKEKSQTILPMSSSLAALFLSRPAAPDQTVITLDESGRSLIQRRPLSRRSFSGSCHLAEPCGGQTRPGSSGSAPNIP